MSAWATAVYIDILISNIVLSKLVLVGCRNVVQIQYYFASDIMSPSQVTDPLVDQSKGTYVTTCVCRKVMIT